MRTVKTVIAAFDVVGFHNWPEAPDAVRYLAAPHRHRFAVRVECRVADSDREVEFHTLQRAAREMLTAVFRNPDDRLGEVDFGRHSCEQIADALLRTLHAHSWPATAVEVWEDRECGARVEVERTFDIVQELGR